MKRSWPGGRGEGGGGGEGGAGYSHNFRIGVCRKES